MTTYTDYLNTLALLREHPNQVNSALQTLHQTHDQAVSLADKSITAAEKASADALGAIDAQLDAARRVLEPLGKQSLVPPRIKPSGTATSATSQDLADAQHALVRAVNQLRAAADAEIKRQTAERERLAQEAAERAEAEHLAAERAAARRKRMIQIAAALGSLVAVLIVIFVLAL